MKGIITWSIFNRWYFNRTLSKYKVLGIKYYLVLQDLYREYQGALDAEDDEEESNDEDSDGEEMDQDDNNRSKLDQVHSQKL